MFGLEDKVIFVTGGNRGIGAAIVETLTDLGAKVAYTYRSEPGPDAALAIKADVTDPASMEAAAAQIEEEIGEIYGVVLNAGITKDNLFPNISVADWYAVIDTNLNGVFNTLRPIVPKLYERGNGSLVFISSVVGEAGNIGQANYAASKSAVIGLAKTLGLEGSRYGVRANVVAPGFTSTDMVKSIPEKVQERILSKIPMRRFAEPEEIAWATAFLLSPVMAGYITGEILSVNGGQYT
ncbi:MAG TPA: SDR family oxidoreductase [Caldilineaceae bacterium]|nr:SDR family oxidoreductase [Caldilineaceae bacterium]